MTLLRFRPLLGLALALSLLLVGCRRTTASAKVETLPRLAVQTARVELTTDSETLPLAGTIRPFAHAVVNAKVMGTVTKLDLALGQTVRAGDVLVTLTAPEIAARVDEARVALSQATRDFERESGLAAQGASSAEGVRSLANRQSMARAALVEAEALLSYTRITAPFDGVVTQQLINAGDLAMPGTPLFAIEGKTHFRIEIQVPESLATQPLGAPIEVELDPSGKSLKAMLVELSPAADPAARARLAKLDLPADFASDSGQFVHVLWPKGESSALTLPASALSVFGQMERVWVVANDDRAHLRLVKTAARTDARITLLSGVVAGERVVLAPPASLRDGQPLDVIP
jgi:RND family efflux transporter MFP subunit